MKKQLFIFKYILFCCYFASFSCKTSNDLPNIYVGEYFDENYRYTLPVIIAFMGSDTVQVAKILNEGIKVNIYMLNHDSLIGKEKYKYHFGGNESLTLTDEKHHFYFKKNSSFHQKEIHLSGKAYEFNINDPNNDLSIIESWHFKDDSLMINRDYYYLNELCHAEVEVERYNILNYDNKCRFLVFKGEKSPEIFWQIIPSKEDDIFLFNYNSGNAILGKSSSIHTRNAKKFSVSEKQHLYQYYQFKNKPTPINGYNDLKRNMVKNCSSTHIDGPDGYIVLRFVLNQQGEIGRFELELMNRNYQPAKYSFKSVSKIISEAIKYKWNPAQIENEVYDCSCFLIFKIKNHQLIDVYI